MVVGGFLSETDAREEHLLKLGPHFCTGSNCKVLSVILTKRYLPLNGRNNYCQSFGLIPLSVCPFMGEDFNKNSVFFQSLCKFVTPTFVETYQNIFVLI